MTTDGFYNTNLPPHLRVLKDEIEGYARDYGLDFYETIFEVVDADDLNEIAAYGGFPTRYPHWSFGMAYEELSRSYSYGLSKIYEMVINNDPCYAYLMRCNHTVDQKLVMAHVYGHCDFFKNNAYFAHTSRKMMDEIANHGNRIRRYAERYGDDAVEAFVDRCMSLDDLIDIHSVAIRRREDPNKSELVAPNDDADDEPQEVRFKSKDYMNPFMNPEAKGSAEDEAKRLKAQPNVASFPERPEKDVLLFLIEHAPLKNWQRDVLSIVRDEAYYFYPQAQTKIINEGWACVAPETLIPTDRGFVTARELTSGRIAATVSDGETTRAIYGWAEFAERETVTIQTRRGQTLTGSSTHRVLLSDGSWKPLRELQTGDRIRLARGTDLWAKEPVRIQWSESIRPTLEHVAESAGVSLWTVLRHRDGKNTRSKEKIIKALKPYEAGLATLPVGPSRKAVRIPNIVDEDFAAFLGYIIGDGHISTKKRVMGLTTGDAAQADHFAELVEKLFGKTPRIKDERGKTRVLFSSRAIQNLLLDLGLTSGISARIKSVPDCILRSPANVVAAFLRALYDCDGYAGPAGVILSTSSSKMGEVVQQLLLNFGILSRRRLQADGCWHVHTAGQSAAVFSQLIGFGLGRKQTRLQEYIDNRQLYKTESDDDTVVDIQCGRGPVVDFSVEETHRYVAAGMINHNSYWHSTIMTQKVLHPSELIDYADHHSGTMATSGKRLNPYKLGIELLRDVERRWNAGQFGPEWDACDDLDTKRSWNRDLGLGRKKIYEARKVHNDITFIDTFLTPEFCAENKLFGFGYRNDTKNYVIDTRDFEAVKQKLLFSLTNFGKPWIYVVNGNHRNRGELLLKHGYNGVELNLNEARDTLRNVQFIWSRPVHIETVCDDKPTLLSFDGTDHTQQTIGADNDPRRNAPGKTR
jgi:stage V sporulation protein R